ncbi:MAG: hypothetical protein J7K75_08085 [Desulfuromonas sp.]|nr:hypothetical protein [Desulfuromonas sp.]
MHWFAYLIWGGLLLCVLAGLGCYLYSRFADSVTPAVAVDNDDVEITDNLTLDTQRWLSLVEQFSIDPAIVPETAHQRILWAHECLGVEVDWLRGRDVAMYPCLSFHHAVDRCIDFVAEKKKETAPLRLFAIKLQGVELDEAVYEASVVLCFSHPVDCLGHRLWRYYPVNVFWEWGYLPEQNQCRQIFYLAQSAGCELIGIETDTDDLYEVLEGIAIPACLQGDKVESSWPVEEYAYAGKEVPGQGANSLSSDQLQVAIERAGLIDS